MSFTVHEFTGSQVKTDIPQLLSPATVDNIILEELLITHRSIDVLKLNLSGRRKEEDQTLLPFLSGLQKKIM
jgi:hypothetical protein